MRTIARWFGIGLLGCCAAGFIRAEENLDLAAAEKTIDAVNADWIPALRAGDADRFAKPYAENAIFITASGRTVAGRQAIAALMRQRLTGRKVLEGSLHQTALQEVKGYLFEWGTASLTLASADGPHTTSGVYFTIWRRSPGGAWEIIRNLTL